jgi:hypothetical protein
MKSPSWEILWSQKAYAAVFDHWARNPGFTALRFITEVVQALSDEPYEVGESRDEDRVTFVGKNTVHFEVNHEHRAVRVTGVRFRA